MRLWGSGGWWTHFVDVCDDPFQGFTFERFEHQGLVFHLELCHLRRPSKLIELVSKTESSIRRFQVE